MKKLCLLFLMCCLSVWSMAADDQIWITTGSDAFGDIAQTVGKRGPAYAMKVYAQRDGVTLTKVPGKRLGEISEMMHEKHRRCGGFMAHATYEDALASLARESMAASQKMLVGYNIDNAATVNPMLNGLDQQNIEDTIFNLSNFYTRYHSSQTGTDAAIWIKAAWEDIAQSRSDITVSLYNHSGTSQPSVILTIPGTTQASEIVVIGGHLDSINGSTGRSPGADDNASGIATITEILRTAIANGYAPARTVKLMGYAAEEVGLVGSGEIAAAAVSNGDNVVGVVQFDMTNYNGSTPKIVMMTDYTNAAQNGFLGNLIDAYVGVDWAYDTCGYGCSDHASWNNRGFPASMPFEALMGQYNPTIHSANDTIAQSGSNASHAMHFARLGVAYLAELAKGGLNGDTGPGLPTTENFSGSLGKNQEVVFGPFSVEAGSQFSASSTGTGNIDLYVGFGSAPTTSSSDCAGTSRNSTESCSVTVPAGQSVAYVMLRGTRKNNSYDLAVTYSAP